MCYYADIKMEVEEITKKDLLEMIKTVEYFLYSILTFFLSSGLLIGYLIHKIYGEDTLIMISLIMISTALIFATLYLNKLKGK